MEILAVIGVCVLTAFLSLIFKDLQKEYSFLITAAGGIAIFIWGVSKLVPVMEYLLELANLSGISTYLSLIMKAVGVGFAVAVASDICRDLGAESVAAKLEFAGKVSILAMSLPVIRSVVGIGMELLA